jgi:hypothetical protein
MAAGMVRGFFDFFFFGCFSVSDELLAMDERALFSYQRY